MEQEEKRVCPFRRTPLTVTTPWSELTKADVVRIQAQIAERAAQEPRCIEDRCMAWNGVGCQLLAPQPTVSLV